MDQYTLGLDPLPKKTRKEAILEAALRCFNADGFEATTIESIGGVLTERITVTKALWIFGVIQGLSNVGYALIAAMPVDRTLLYVAVSLENFTGGLGTKLKAGDQITIVPAIAGG